MAFEILNDHVTHYVQGALASGDPKAAKEKSEELLAEVERFTETR